MVKVKECCCGCTLRTGTLILAWMVLVWNSLVFIVTSTILAYPINGRENKLPSNYRQSPYLVLIYLLVESIIAMVISIVAIWAVQKKKAKFLNGLFWYFCYCAGLYVLAIIAIIFDPEVEKKIAPDLDPAAEYSYSLIQNHLIVAIMLYLFIAALAVYFALVVKSNRDYMLKNRTQIGDYEANCDLPDPTAVGYINNI